MSEMMKKAEYLFDEIGLIDDRLIAEAMSEQKVGRGALSIRRLTVAAVAAAMVFTASVGLTLSALIRNSDKNDGVPSQDSATDGVSLVASLAKAEVCGATVYAEAESIDLFDGSVKIIWENAEHYYALEVSGASEIQKLERALRTTYSKAEKVGTDEGVRVWISYGDGSVISPYLSESAGNVGYGVVFDYSPEIVPADDLARLVDDLITP